MTNSMDPAPMGQLEESSTVPYGSVPTYEAQGNNVPKPPSTTMAPVTGGTDPKVLKAERDKLALMDEATLRAYYTEMYTNQVTPVIPFGQTRFSNDPGYGQGSTRFNYSHTQDKSAFNNIYTLTDYDPTNEGEQDVNVRNIDAANYIYGNTTDGLIATTTKFEEDRTTQNAANALLDGDEKEADRITTNQVNRTIINDLINQKGSYYEEGWTIGDGGKPVPPVNQGQFNRDLMREEAESWEKEKNRLIEAGIMGDGSQPVVIEDDAKFNVAALPMVVASGVFAAGQWGLNPAADALFLESLVLAGISTITYKELQGMYKNYQEGATMQRTIDAHGKQMEIDFGASASTATSAAGSHPNGPEYDPKKDPDKSRAAKFAEAVKKWGKNAGKLVWNKYTRKFGIYVIVGGTGRFIYEVIKHGGIGNTPDGQNRNDKKKEKTLDNDEWIANPADPSGWTLMNPATGDIYDKRTGNHFTKDGEPIKNRGQNYEFGGSRNTLDRMRQYSRGGEALPGGMMESIPGSDAVKFNGQTHEEGGIELDSRTEVEDGETMDKVNMSKGGPSDYFFSKKLGFADKHERLLANGGSQTDINYLAKMQEKAAGRNPSKIAAEYGGVRKFEEGGANRKTDRQYAYGEDYTENVGGAHGEAGYTGLGSDGSYTPTDPGEEGYANTQSSIGKKGNNYWGDKHIMSDEGRKDFYNRNKNILNGMDINSWEDYDPAKHAGDFQKAFNTDLKERYNKDENLRNSLKSRGINSVEDFTQQAGFHNKGHKSKRLDNAHGEYTWSRTSAYNEPEDKEIIPPTDDGGGDEEITTTDLKVQNQKKGFNLLGAAQLIPAAMAFMDKPDYMESPDLVAPGIVVPERISKTHLERVNYNNQRDKEDRNYQGLRQDINTSGIGGGSAMSNRLAAYAMSEANQRKIDADESNVNVQIGNQEGTMDQQRKGENASNMLSASTTNASNYLDADKTNAKNAMYVDEFNSAADAATFDRKLDAVQSGVQGVAGMWNDQQNRNTQERIAFAEAGNRGTYERERAKWDSKNESERLTASNSSTSESSTSTTKRTFVTGADGTKYWSDGTSEKPGSAETGGPRYNTEFKKRLARKGGVHEGSASWKRMFG